MQTPFDQPSSREQVVLSRRIFQHVCDDNAEVLRRLKKLYPRQASPRQGAVISWAVAQSRLQLALQLLAVYKFQFCRPP